MRRGRWQGVCTSSAMARCRRPQFLGLGHQRVRGVHDVKTTQEAYGQALKWSASTGIRWIISPGFGDGAKRRVPAERRRTPGERSTAAKMNARGESYVLSDPGSRRRGSLEHAPERLRVERERRRSRGKRIALVVFGVIAVLLVTAGVGVAAFAMKIQNTMQGTIVKQEKLNVVLVPAKPMEPYNLLLLGVDRRPKEKAFRTDTMIVAHIDPQKKAVWMLSIPRDTKVSIPGHGERKINDAHFYGGPKLTIQTVQKFTGLKINHYMEVDFTAFEKAVDSWVACGSMYLRPSTTARPTAARVTARRRCRPATRSSMVNTL